jgi:CyaY protein
MQQDKPMKNHEYHALVDGFFLFIEDAIDADYPDIDCERNGGVLTLSFENNTKIIINKQEPLQQIWVATRENGFHFEWQGAAWIDNRFGHELTTLVASACSRQSDSEVRLG